LLQELFTDEELAGAHHRLEELGEKIIKERYFIGGPKQVARNVIRTDIRLYYDETTKMVSLANWK
jgi:hypothetical protein